MKQNTSKLRKPYMLLLLNLIPCPVTGQNNRGPNTAFGRNKAMLTRFVLHEKQTQTTQSASQHNRSQPVNTVTCLRFYKSQDKNSKSIFCTYFIILTHRGAGQGRCHTTTEQAPSHGPHDAHCGLSGLCLHGGKGSCKTILCKKYRCLWRGFPALT